MSKYTLRSGRTSRIDEMGCRGDPSPGGGVLCRTMFKDFFCGRDATQGETIIRHMEVEFSVILHRPLLKSGIRVPEESRGPTSYTLLAFISCPQTVLSR